jgi:hypothetical protein
MRRGRKSKRDINKMNNYDLMKLIDERCKKENKKQEKI